MDEEFIEILRHLGTKWYKCPNGHAYTIGECGLPMEESICPECKEKIGGRDHVPLKSNKMVDFEKDVKNNIMKNYPKNSKEQLNKKEINDNNNQKIENKNDEDNSNLNEQNNKKENNEDLNEINNKESSNIEDTNNEKKENDANNNENQDNKDNGDNENNKEIEDNGESKE